MNGIRGRTALDQTQIERCKQIWQVLKGYEFCNIDLSEATQHCSKTRFSETHNLVFIGSDVVPGRSTDARSRMSELACLAHELAHAARFRYGFVRPVDLPDKLLDEAEASLHASWYIPLNASDRFFLVDDARDQLRKWVSVTQGSKE